MFYLRDSQSLRRFNVNPACAVRVGSEAIPIGSIAVEPDGPELLVRLETPGSVLSAVWLDRDAATRLVESLTDHFGI